MRKILLSCYRGLFLSMLVTGAYPGSMVMAGTFQDSLRTDTANRAGLVPNQIFQPAKLKVLYGEQNRDRHVQSTSFLDGKRLEAQPVTLLSNAFAGHLAGLNSTSTNGAPRYDNPALSLRGRAPLIVIDGVPRYSTVYNELSLNPEQIESVTLLKDGLATVMYGNRGMDGVLMITTRTKSREAGSEVSFTAQAGAQSAIGMRKALSAYDFASLYNEARVNSGLQPAYSQTQLDAYRNGTDEFLAPNVNWQDAILKNNAPQMRYTLNAGGNFSNVKYFLSLDHQKQAGLLREDPVTPYTTNVDYSRYIFRSNIELNVDKNMTAYLHLVGNIQDFIQPGVGYGSVFQGLLNTPSNATSIYNFRGTFAGSREYPNNPYADATSSGYLKNNLQAAAVNVGLKQNADKILKGSWIKALMSYSPSYEQAIDRSKGYNAYNYPVTGDTTNYLRVSRISEQPNSATVENRFQQTYLELSTGVDRAWNNNALSALVVASYDNSQQNNALNQIFQGISARVNYSFDNRFNFELAGAYTGNNRFNPGKQAEFYPGGGISWNLHNEGFMQGNSFFDQLKLRATYAKVGNADPGYYLWRQTYASASAYFFGTGVTSTPATRPGDLANPNRVAEKANKLNIGFDLAFSNNKGWVNLDYFNNNQYDMLQTRGHDSFVLGSPFPDENIGKSRYSGVELNLGWANSVGRLSYSVSGNISTVKSEITFNDEPAQPYAWMARTGSPINQMRGYIAEGFYNSGNLNSPALEGYQPVEGDVRYRDLNNDGVISVLDQTIIGNDKPLIYYGANFGLRYSGFDMNVLIQGVQNRDIMTTGNYQTPFNQNGLGNAFEYNMGRYTPATAATATLPRVTLERNVNNTLNSSLYVRDASYLRLKNVELGYTFNPRVLPTSVIKGLRLFVNGQNLATSSRYKDSDPENFTGLYPIQRIINGGLSIKL